MIKPLTKALLLFAIFNCWHHQASASNDKLEETSQAAHEIPKDLPKNGPSESLVRELSTDQEITVKYPMDIGSSRVTSFRRPRNNDYSAQQMVIIKPGKIKPGHYAGSNKGGNKASKRKNNWKIPDALKGVIPEADSKVSWSYWETDDTEFWPDDADDSKPTTIETTTMATTTTTTTTPAPATKATKGPVSVHKHFHYFKKAAPWKLPMPMPPMPPEEMMMMTEEMMNEMMKGMMPDSMPPTKAPDKKGISGVLHKLSEVDPVTVLVAGIIPASLILAAALPSMMNKMMNKGDATMMPPMMMMPMVTTTAMGPAMETMGSRQIPQQQSISEVLQAVSTFGKQALKDPRCAKKKFCELARKNLMLETPEFERALRVAIISMKDSWLDALGVRDILHSLAEGTCETEDCEWEPENDFLTVTQPTPPA